jgi:raffinose/stachyose/melibiose transport system permease protein
MRSADKKYPLFWLLPALLFYVVFFILPQFYGVYISMTNQTMGLDTDVVGFVWFDNYLAILDDTELLRAFGNTFYYAVIVVLFKNLLGLVLALAVATTLFRGKWVNNSFRSILYIPSVISTIVLSIVFTRILHPEGALNQLLRGLGLSSLALDWLTDAKVVMTSIAMVSIWQYAGYHMVIYLAGLQAIPRDYYESAMIDGANSWQRLRYITLPMLASSISINLILSLLGGIKVFSEVYALTNGGPGTSSQVITTEILMKFSDGRWALGTAMNMVLLLVVSVLSIPLLKRLRTREVEE